MWMRRRARVVANQRLNRAGALIVQAKDAGHTVMPGRTHMQHAQPVLLAHQLIAHVWPLLRDVERLRDWDQRVDASPYGSGALAGNTLGLEPVAVARELGFGAGMGLPNMKRYSDEMTIDTEVGKGTTVTVKIKVS